MKNAITVVKEQINNFYLIRRLSLYELKSKNKNNYLGISWEFINPSIQILIYWFVFSSIRQRADIELLNGDEVPFIIWLVSGFVVWIFFYQSTIQGSKSIYSRLRMLSKMNFPMSVIPNFIVFSNFYIHLVMLVITIILFHIFGFYLNLYYLQLIYYIFGTYCLIYALALIMSTFSTIVRDVHMFLNATLRMLLYLSPILWPISSIIDNNVIITILKLNPLYYLIEGYRASLFGTEWYFITHWQYTFYFWCLIIFLFLFGSTVHVKFRKHFIDYL